MHRELAEIWKTIGADEETRAVVVRGADGAFSAGGDLDLVLEIARTTRRGCASSTRRATSSTT